MSRGLTATGGQRFASASVSVVGWGGGHDVELAFIDPVACVWGIRAPGY